jgi:nucleoside-diphosphate-sugar epimerase
MASSPGPAHDPDRRRVLLVTGGTGAIGRTFVPLARRSGFAVHAPGRADLDLFDPTAVSAAVAGVDVIVHLATRIRPLSDIDKPGLWKENDRLRAEVSAYLVDAALSTAASVYLQPTVTFVYPQNGRATEMTPIRADVAPTLRSALAGEAQAARFASAGRRGVILRFGLLDGPGTGNDRPKPVMGATLHVADAAGALAAAIEVESGVYNVCRDGERVSNEKFKVQSGWRPEH